MLFQSCRIMCFHFTLLVILMSFADPLVLTPVGGTATNFPRITEGKYMHPGSTMDQPAYLILRNTLKPGSKSRYLIEYQQHKNVVGQVGQPIPPDDVLRCYINFEVPHRSFSDVDVVNTSKFLRGFINDELNLLRVLTGQV